MLSLAPALILLAGSIGAPSPEPSPVYGGQAAAECGWPTTLHAQSCTATLVHPRVAILAAHCPDPADVFFGQLIYDRQEEGKGRTVPVESCISHPDYLGSESLGDGVDIKACVLGESVQDVPIVPILMGCETAVLRPGKDVTIVGFGVQDIGMSGAKVEVTTPINEVMPSGEVDIGGDGKDSCNGDSGGPVYVQLTEAEGFDGSWRVFGVTSYGKAIGLHSCGKGGYYTQMSAHVPWIEDNIGIDITPCHDADGAWNPGPGCEGFPLAPMADAGQWNACDWSLAPVTSWSKACGLQYDVTGPTIAIEDPLDGARFDLDEGHDSESIPVGLRVDDGDGTGVAEVELLVLDAAGDVVDQQQLDTEPFLPEDVELVQGEYTLVATAIDGRDNRTESNAVSVTIEAARPPDDSPPNDPGGDTDDDDDDDTAPVPQDDLGQTEGCGCQTGAPRIPWFVPLLLGICMYFVGRRGPQL